MKPRPANWVTTDCEWETSHGIYRVARVGGSYELRLLPRRHSLIDFKSIPVRCDWPSLIAAQRAALAHKIRMDRGLSAELSALEVSSLHQAGAR